MLKYTVVIPIYNEEENIGELYRRLTSVLEKLCIDESLSTSQYEIIMIDDGSIDGSWQLIKEFREKDPRVKGISFSRNFGHHASVLAGLAQSNGEYTILMDGDLQNPPEEIPKLIEKMQEGFDVVQGVTQKRHTNFLQNILSKIFHRLFMQISTVDPKTRLGLFRCLRRPVVDSINKLPERAIFLGGLVSWVGFNVTYIQVKRSKRFAGKSKYNFMKRFTLALNAITSFSERPLVFFFKLGMIIFVFSIFMFFYVVFKKIFYGIEIMGWTSLFAGIFFSTGLITLCLSVVGLYISKLFIEVKQRPRYIIKEIEGFNNDECY